MTQPEEREEVRDTETRDEDVPAFMSDQAFSDADDAGLDNAIANTSADGATTESDQ